MAKKHKHFQTIKGKPIGYGLSKRGDSGIYFVLFTGPTGDKERISTGKRDETAALLEAPRLITETFCPMPKLKKGVKPTSPSACRGMT